MVRLRGRGHRRQRHVLPRLQRQRPGLRPGGDGTSAAAARGYAANDRAYAGDAITAAETSVLAELTARRGHYDALQGAGSTYATGVIGNWQTAIDAAVGTAETYAAGQVVPQAGGAIYAMLGGDVGSRRKGNGDPNTVGLENATIHDEPLFNPFYHILKPTYEPVGRRIPSTGEIFDHYDGNRLTSGTGIARGRSAEERLGEAGDLGTKMVTQVGGQAAVELGTGAAIGKLAALPWGFKRAYKTAKWGAGSFKDPVQSLLYHFRKHGAEVGASNAQQYARKAQAFASDLSRAATHRVAGHGDNVVRYIKNGKYIDIDIDGQIISFGTR